MYKANSYVKTNGVYYKGVLKTVKKSKDYLRPLFESFTNSLEAIASKNNETHGGYITINIHSKSDIFTNTNVDKSQLQFDKIVIEDSGIGFDDENFDRLTTYQDDRKGYNNKGSGRLQIIHYFNKCEYESIYQDKADYKLRKFTLSKSDVYLKNDSIIFYNDTSVLSLSLCVPPSLPS